MGYEKAYKEQSFVILGPLHTYGTVINFEKIGRMVKIVPYNQGWKIGSNFKV